MSLFISFFIILLRECRADRALQAGQGKKHESTRQEHTSHRASDTRVQAKPALRFHDVLRGTGHRPQRSNGSHLLRVCEHECLDRVQRMADERRDDSGSRTESPGSGEHGWTSGGGEPRCGKVAEKVVRGEVHRRLNHVRRIRTDAHPRAVRALDDRRRRSLRDALVVLRRWLCQHGIRHCARFAYFQRRVECDGDAGCGDGACEYGRGSLHGLECRKVPSVGDESRAHGPPPRAQRPLSCSHAFPL
mmetsp:Transcript_10353/g.26299  ORF Transcript_10353/g.26299 Transcript_10353/m.26299 type:complete len:247 (-) Transcript_10353:668-1408(-)